MSNGLESPAIYFFSFDFVCYHCSPLLQFNEILGRGAFKTVYVIDFQFFFPFIFLFIMICLATVDEMFR